MQLSSIEYNVIMQAIETYKNELIAQGDVGDLSDFEYSQKETLDALDAVERKIISDNLPL